MSGMAARIVGSAYPLLRLLVPKYVSTLRDLGLAMIEVVRSGNPRPILECRDIVRLARAGCEGIA